jgi:hypothetical protein
VAFTSFAALESHLAGWMVLADQREHGTTHEAANRSGSEDQSRISPTSRRQPCLSRCTPPSADPVVMSIKPNGTIAERRWRGLATVEHCSEVLVLDRSRHSLDPDL